MLLPDLSVLTVMVCAILALRRQRGATAHGQAIHLYPVRDGARASFVLNLRNGLRGYAQRQFGFQTWQSNQVDDICGCISIHAVLKSSKPVHAPSLNRSRPNGPLPWLKLGDETERPSSCRGAS